MFQSILASSGFHWGLLHGAAPNSGSNWGDVFLVELVAVGREMLLVEIIMNHPISSHIVKLYLLYIHRYYICIYICVNVDIYIYEQRPKLRVTKAVSMQKLWLFKYVVRYIALHGLSSSPCAFQVLRQIFNDEKYIKVSDGFCMDLLGLSHIKYM